MIRLIHKKGDMHMHESVNTIPPQFDVIPESVRISNLLANRETYINFPDWQRDSVWESIKKTKLINTILSRRYIHPILCFRGNDGDLGDADKLYILDGQQRLRTIVDFVNGKFATGRSRRLGDLYIEPGRYYHQLSPEAQKRLMSYKLRYEISTETDRQRLIETYKDVQHFNQLKSAEIAFAADSRAKQAAQEIEEHSYFDLAGIYIGQTHRKQKFQMALYLLEMEVFRICCDLREGKIKGLASGARDSLISEDIVSRIIDRLFMALHVFDGVKTRSPNAIICLYQAVFLLQQAGYDLYGSAKGCLFSWYESLHKDMNFYANLTANCYQESFWSSRLQDLSLMPGLIMSSDEIECRRNIERFVSWFRGQYCRECGQVVKWGDIADHSFILSDKCKSVKRVELVRVS